MALRLRQSLARVPSAVADWLLPPVCEICGSPLTDGERHCCLVCLTSLPRTMFHLSPVDNDIHHRVSDNHTLVDRAAAMFHYYRGSSASNLILSAKYRSRPSIINFLGRVYGAEIKSSGFFDGIDAIVPVPIHWTRRMARGYNQTEYLAAGLSRETGIPVARDVVRLPHRHSSQTHRSAMERAANVTDSYAARQAPPSLKGCRAPHLLVVDDIITTGATMRDCLRAIHSAIPGATFSVLAIGLAHHQS